MRVIFLIALACISAAELNDKICWVACRKDGFDTGAYYKNHKCICGEIHDFDQITDTVLKVNPPRDEDRPHYSYTN